MEAGRPSWTAEMVAAIRADHALHDRPVVFDDGFALRLVSAELRASVERGDLHRGLTAGPLRLTQGHLVARARYADDALRAATARGLRQVLVLAAGLDATALRCAPELLVVEVDHPATQELKRSRLAALGPRARPRATLEFAAIDFETTPLAAALAGASFDPARPAFLTWLGVTPYLAEGALREALRGLRDCAGPGSELVFDYPVPLASLPDGVRRTAERKRAYTAAHGEAKRGTWRPEALAAELAALGFELLADLDTAALDARYYAARADGLAASPEHRIAHARVEGGGAARPAAEPPTPSASKRRRSS